MYFAKRSGRGSVRFYSVDLARSEADRLRLFQELQKCVDLDQLELYYQPKFDLKTGNLIGSEALLRWNHPTRGLLGPTEFIAVAEESGLIVDIGLWVLKEACIQAAAWRESGLAAHPRVDINLSARQLMDSEFPTIVSAMLSKYNLDGNAIGLEITESMLSVDMDQAARVLEAFRSMGLPVALDDFGTGYSNLSYIQRFPITTLKIDKSFVQKIETSNNSRALVSGIISMARALQLEVVAEGVETAAQLKFLLLQQCDAMQGYLASPAVPGAEFRDRFLREERQVNILDTFGDGN
jgi:EAL domain-containing protein (putative c-di-GMP-specific phosphodiesterase class I)